MKTTQITVRNVDPLLKRRIDKLAKLKSMSINDLVLETLRDKVGGKVSSSSINWQHYSGILKDNFDASVFEGFEAVDPTMWK